MSPAEAASEALAAIDIGTNSIHLVVARAVAPERFEILATEKEMVRLGSGRSEMKVLSDAAIDRGVAALDRCRAIAEAQGAPVRAVATSAVREAGNQAEFLTRARVESGVTVEVVSGFEEARLIYLGALQALPIYEDRALVVDIGGGSTELVVGERGDTRLARSLKLGAIRLTERFFADGATTKKQAKQCRRWVRGVLAPVAARFDELGPETTVITSGTLENLAVMAAAARGDTEQQTLNGLEVTAGEIHDVVDRILEAGTPKKRGRLAGLEPRRNDIIAAGAVIADEVVRAFDIETMVVSEYALREGVLLDTFRRRHGASLHHLRDLRRRSVLRLAELTDEDPAHSARVAGLALELFDQTAAWHGLEDRHREHLEAAALLSNVGLFISHSAHHKHSYYVIRHAEHLTGFTDDEIEVIAQVARYHRRSEPKSKHEAFAALDADGKRVVRTLAGVLRIAIGLDRAHSGTVTGISVREARPDEAGGPLVVGLVAAPGADVERERYSADERKGLLADVLGRDITFEVPS